MSTGESKTAKVAYLTGQGLACAVLAAVMLGGCTEDLSQNIIIVNNKYDSPFGLVLVRDDYNPASTVTQTVPTYHFKVDGKFATWDASTYVSLGPGAFTGLTLPAGSHVITLVDDAGKTVATSPAFEARSAQDPSNPPFQSTIVFYGGESNLNVRVLVDDVAVLSAGATHIRMMNALADRQTVQVVQCGDDAGGTTHYTASACAHVGNPLAYGNLFEMDAGADVVGKLGFALAGSTAVDPGVIAFTYGPSTAPSNGTTDRFVTRIAVQEMDPSSVCPSCLVTTY